MTIPNDANTYLSPVIAIPSSLEITNMTNSNPMVITTSANSDQMNTYIPQQVVRLNVPATFGMIQANGLIPQIIAINGNNITVDVDSILFDSFVVPATGGPASLAPSGSKNLQFSNLTGQVPFQSLNNVGN